VIWVTLVLTILGFCLGFIIDPFVILLFGIGIVPGIIFLIYFIISERKQNWNNAQNNYMARNI
jgi:TM2 domain-containing membrane protein YozV